MIARAREHSFVTRGQALFRATVLAALTAISACGQSSDPGGNAQGTSAATSAATGQASGDCADYLDRLSRTDHMAADFNELMDNTAMAHKCITQAQAADTAAARKIKAANPVNGFVNFESAHVHPLDMTPDGSRLLAVNTANHSLEVFTISNGSPTLARTIAVGIDPISVRARNNNEAWVVNKLSDSISIVDLVNGRVTQTLDTDDEPSDVVFAANGSKAFVSCAQPNRVMVFSLANLAATPVRLSLDAEKPKAMAVSADGNRVFVAAFESGNTTTVLNGRLGPISTGVDLGSDDVVSLAIGPYAGVNPPPNSGNSFMPARNTALGNQVSSIIVRKRADNTWTDDNGRNWSQFVSGANATRTRRVAGWDLPDRDVAIIDANTNAVTYQRGLMNIVMAIAVNPASGAVTVVGTDATNEVRFEPNLKGVFLRVNRATFLPGDTATITDLNTHLDYSVRNIAPAQRAQSIGDPRGIKWNAAGTRAFVTGMGSNNVIVMGTAGQRLGRIAVGKGPTGVVLNEVANRAYVLNKFDGSISVIDTQSLTQLSQVSYFDPTPAVIKNGRPFLYDTHLTSGLGHMSCASCHVDARHDRLAWDLGNPAGSMEGVHHPMKGPMVTQSLQDIMRFPNLHWRGDRANLAAFNPAYVDLQGADAPISAAQMTAFGDFLATIHWQPNPFRNIDNTLPTSLALPTGVTTSAVDGRTALAACLPCHLANQTRTHLTNSELSQNVIPPSFHGFYQRLGFWNNSATRSTSGTGFFHDGVDPILSAARGNNFLAAIMTFEGPDNGLAASSLRQDTHAAVGKQITLNGTISSTQTSRLTQFIGLADSSIHLAMLASGTVNGQRRAWIYAGSNRFTSPANGNAVSTRAELEALATAGTPVTFTLVVQGTESSMAASLDSQIVTNRAPLVTNPGFQSTTQNRAVGIGIQASDPDNDPFTFSASGLPTGLGINPANGVISGVASTVGSFTVTVSATDSKGATGSTAFTWNITAASQIDGFVSPTPGTLLTNTSATFTWNWPWGGLTSSTILLGSWPGANDIATLSNLTVTSAAFTNLPLDGRTIYARVIMNVGGVTVVRDGLWETRAPWGDNGVSRMLSPVPGGTLNAGAMTFNWSNVGSSQHRVFVGSGIGWEDIASLNTGTATSATININANSGAPVYVRLWTFTSGGWWEARDYQFVGPQ